MRLTILAVLASLVVAGCGKVRAQNGCPANVQCGPSATDPKVGTLHIDGPTTIRIQDAFTNLMKPCPVGFYYHGTPEGDIECAAPAGKPPRWVSEQYIPSNGHLMMTCDEADDCTEIRIGAHMREKGHWECDKGYELDGFNVTWPNGIAQISPARCKARP